MLLHELCADRADPSQRYKRRKGDGMKKYTMKDIISLLERRGDVLEETFAAVDLANLPPVSFDSLDVCALLARVEATKGEMEMMKTSFNLMTDTLAAQASVCDDLRKAMQGLVDSRVDTRPTTTERRHGQPSGRLSPLTTLLKCCQSAHQVALMTLRHPRSQCQTRRWRSSHRCCGRGTINRKLRVDRHQVSLHGWMLPRGGRRGLRPPSQVGGLESALARQRGLVASRTSSQRGWHPSSPTLT